MTRALVVAVLAGLARVAHADPQQEAGEHFARGEQAQQQGRFRDAISDYEQAFALLPHPNALFNIGVCYEKLGEWRKSADYYERYLDLDKSAPDASTVTEKIRTLRAKAGPGPITPGDPGSSQTGIEPEHTGIIKRDKPIDEVPTSKFTRWHVGVSYGVGVGDTAVERYLAHGGLRFADHLEFDGVFGRFGKNDLALGATGNFVISRGPVSPFLHGAATIGYAKQDHSSEAGTKLPLGFEAGGGIRFGTRARLEFQALLRFTRGGWDDTSTVVDSYVNDAVAFAVDLGFAFDIPSTLVVQ